MNKKEEEKPTSVRIPPQIKEEIQKIADLEDRSFSAQLIRFARIGLKQYKKKSSK